MMASFMSYFGGRKDSKQAAREAIVGLRQQLQLIEKKEEYLQKKIEEETKKARANAVTNKNIAKQALIRKRAHEQDLDKLAGTRLQLESQVNTLESANLNAETMAAMKKGADVLKTIHGNMTLDKVDATMAAIEDQRTIANEISEAISNPAATGYDFDEDELKAELAELEQDQLNQRLMEADHVPIHAPSKSISESHRTVVAEEDDEDAQLKELQASLAM